MIRLLLGIAVICSVAAGCCGAGPHLSATQNDREVEIDVMTLGEYFKSIKTIRPTVLPTSEVMWELTADKVIPRIWTFTMS